jgi:3-isopropylmalate/(R)-2-methylmalate dehydratase large subunit
MFLGATTMLIAPDARTMAWLEGRTKLDLAPVYPDADAVYERVVTIDVSALEPIIVVPPSPANTRDLSEHLGIEVHTGYLGSCASGRLEDLRAAAEVLRGRQVKPGFQLNVVGPARASMAFPEGGPPGVRASHSTAVLAPPRTANSRTGN